MVEQDTPLETRHFLNTCGKNTGMDEKLIEGVRNYSCLWQVSSRCYKDLRAKENALEGDC